MNNKKTIVIAEDSITQAVRLKLILQENNYNVLVGNDGLEALKLCEQQKPHLIISDIVMPEMNGFEFCNKIKSNPLLCDIPVVLLTTLSESESILRAIEAGANYYITKPYESEYIISRITSILDSPVESTVENYNLAYQARGGKLNVFTSSKPQIIQLLLSTYENAIEQNRILKTTQDKLEELNSQLNQKVEERTASLLREIQTRKAAEVQIRQSELKFRSIIESANDAVVIGDAQGNIILWNKGAEQIFGYTSDEIINQPIMRLMSGEHQDHNSPVYSRFVDFQESAMKGSHIEIDALRKDGSIFPISMSLSYWETENAVFLSAIIKDITQRKTTEKQQLLVTKILSLLNNHSQWQKLIDDILNELKLFTGFESVGIQIYERDDFAGNTQTKHFLQFSELLKSVAANNSGNVHSTTFISAKGSFYSNNIRDYFSTSDAVQTYIITTCGNNEFNSLALIPLESGKETIGLLKFSDKQIGQFTPEMIQYFEEIGSTISIAFKRMQAENMLKTSEENFRSIYDNSTLGLYRATPRDQIIMTSPAFIAMLGYSSAETLFSKEKQAPGKHFNKQSRETFRRTIENYGVIFGFESEWTKADGSAFIARESAKAIKDAKGNSLYYEGTVEDVTKMKIAEMQLIVAKDKAEEMNRLKSSFLANMSHELRTPMIGILGFSEILLDQATDPEILFNAEIINKSGRRLMDTLNLILDLATIEASKLGYKPNKIDIVSVVTELAESYTGAAEVKSLYLNVETSIPSLDLFIDNRLLQHIISNLINNAIKFTSTGGIRISIGTENINLKNMVVIKVSDTGIGIAEENQKFIWDEFRQVSEGLSRTYEGTGLGLTIAKNFVTKLNGDIFITSEIGKGSTFTIQIPIINQIAETTELQLDNKSGDLQQPIITPANKISKLLYVEDDPVSARLVTIILKQICNIVTVASGVEAVKRANQEKFDIILMDINLGPTSPDGIQTTQLIRENPDYEHTPIVAITAFDSVGDRENYLASGFAGFISKPFTKKIITALISSLLVKMEQK